MSKNPNNEVSTAVAAEAAVLINLLEEFYHKCEIDRFLDEKDYETLKKWKLKIN